MPFLFSSKQAEENSGSATSDSKSPDSDTKNLSEETHRNTGPTCSKLSSYACGGMIACVAANFVYWGIVILKPEMHILSYASYAITTISSFVGGSGLSCCVESCLSRRKRRLEIDPDDSASGDPDTRLIDSAGNSPSHGQPLGIQLHSPINASVATTPTQGSNLNITALGAAKSLSTGVGVAPTDQDQRTVALVFTSLQAVRSELPPGKKADKDQEKSNQATHYTEETLPDSPRSLTDYTQFG